MKTLGGYEIVDEKAREDIENVRQDIPTKTSELENDSNFASKDYVEEEIAKFDFIKIVTELPEVGLQNRTYLVSKTSADDNDLYDEYLWVNDNWEYLGTKKIEVDLTDYVKNTDYATAEKAGVVSMAKWGAYGLYMAGDGSIIAISKASDTEIDDKNNLFKPITPSNLDYAVMKALSDSKLEWTDEQKQLARALLGSVGSDYIATGSKPGLTYAFHDYGITVNYAGMVLISPASKSQIDEKKHAYKPITPETLEYAVKKALSDCKLSGDDVWTDEEKAKALELLGGVDKKYVDDLVGSVESILTELHAYAQTKIGGEA